MLAPMRLASVAQEVNVGNLSHTGDGIGKSRDAI